MASLEECHGEVCSSPSQVRAQNPSNHIAEMRPGVPPRLLAKLTIDS